MLVWTLMAGCASTYEAGGPRRPDGRLFESNAEHRAYHGLPPAEASPAAVRPPSTPANPSPGSLAYLDARNGFRDLTFGDPPQQGMRVVEDHGDTKYYTRPSDDLTIGGAKIKEISYGFYKGRLYSVLIETEGLLNSRALLEVLQQAYGTGSRPNRFMDEYMWDGSRVLLYYDQKPVTNEAITMFQSIPLKNEKTGDEKAKAWKGASGL
jgi:hypothetical protein